MRGIALLLAFPALPAVLSGCLDEDLALTALGHGAGLELVGARAFPLSSGTQLVWTADGSALAIYDDDQPQVWDPEADLRTDLAGYRALDHGMEGSTFLALDRDGVCVIDAQGRVVRRLAELPNLGAAGRLVSLPDQEAVLLYQPGEHTAWGPPRVIPLDLALPAREIAARELDFPGICLPVPEQGFLMSAYPEQCGVGPGIGDLWLIDRDGVPKGRIGTSFPDRDFPGDTRERLIASPQRFSLAPAGDAVVYTATRDGIPRIGRLTLPGFRHTRGRDGGTVQDLIHLDDHLLLVSVADGGSHLEVWDAVDLATQRKLPIAGGELLALSPDGTRLAVGDLAAQRVHVYRVRG